LLNADPDPGRHIVIRFIDLKNLNYSFGGTIEHRLHIAYCLTVVENLPTSELFFVDLIPRVSHFQLEHQVLSRRGFEPCPSDQEYSNQLAS
jgi:hypothetical protein